MSSITFFPSSGSSSNSANEYIVVANSYLPLVNEDGQRLIALRGQFTSSGTGSFTGFREEGATAGYTPSGANDFRLVAALFQTSTAADGQIYISDTDQGIASNTAPGVATFWGGSAALSYFMVSAMTARAEPYERNIGNFIIPNGSFIGSNRSSGTGDVIITLYGYEQA